MSSSPGEIITTSQMATVMKRVTKSIGGATVKGLRTAAHVAKARAVQSIREVPSFNSDVQFAPIDFGAAGGMLGSYTVENVSDGAVLENQAPHAAIQEFGTRPFTPPMAPLKAWAERKVRKAKRGKQRAPKLGPKFDTKQGPKQAPMLGPKFQKPLSDKKQAEANALARRAFNSIRARGVKAKGFHSHASQYFGGYVADALAQRISKVTK